MPNFPKALTHHGHIGRALKAKDHATAMHHVGHLMAALRASGSSSNGADEPEPSPAIGAAPVPEMAPMVGIRGRLAAFRKPPLA